MRRRTQLGCGGRNGVPDRHTGVVWIREKRQPSDVRTSSYCYTSPVVYSTGGAIGTGELGAPAGGPK